MPDTAPKPDFVLQTFIRTSQDRLWAALTEPDEAGAFHVAAASARRRFAAPGDRMEYADADGRPLVAHEVRAIAPRTRLDLTFEPLWAGPGVRPSRCAYLIEVEGAACRLTVEHWDIPPGQEGVTEGWARMLSGLQTWIETGAPARVTMGGAA